MNDIIYAKSLYITIVQIKRTLKLIISFLNIIKYIYIHIYYINQRKRIVHICVFLYIYMQSVFSLHIYVYKYSCIYT